MAKNPLTILAVGKLKNTFFKDAANHYLARIRRWRDVEEKLVADADSALPPADKVRLESAKILAALGPADWPLCLDEKGEQLTSRQFARLLADIGQHPGRVPCFILGGAYGMDNLVREKARHVLALGPMTLPHELARVVLYEQIYRAESILRGLPYHHD